MAPIAAAPAEVPAPVDVLGRVGMLAPVGIVAPAGMLTEDGQRVSALRVRSSILDASALGVAGAWPAGQVLLARSEARCLLALLAPPMRGEALTSFLGRVSPFGCPAPPSLVRAYSLPDSMFPSILLREHAEAPDGLGAAYLRFAGEARRHWLAALRETGAGLTPAIAWEVGRGRRFLDADGLDSLLDQVGVALPGAPDTYLGRALLLLSQPGLADGWPTEMSLGGPTKARRITGREFPVWVDLPSHETALLGCSLLARAEALLAGG